MASYSVPGPRRIAPPVRASTSCLMAYPCRAPSASATMMWSTGSESGFRGRPAGMVTRIERIVRRYVWPGGLLSSTLGAMKALLLAVALVLALPAQAPAQSVPTSVPDPAVAGPEAATQAYLATLSAEQKARSDSYFEGGYWLQLWSFLWSAAVLVLLLHTGLSARMRDLSARVTRSRLLQPAIYWVGFLLATTILSFPLTVYAGFYREHQYG